MPNAYKGFTTRRGRPAILRSVIDRGTPELAAKRRHNLTTEVVDLLHKNGIITEQELWCALHFRWLYIVRFGNPTLQSVDFSGHHHYTPPLCNDPAWKEKRNTEYRAIADILHHRGLLTLLLRVAVFNDNIILQAKQSATIKKLFTDALNFLCEQWNPPN